MLVVTLLIQPACAETVTISFSDLNIGRNFDIEVYQPTSNGSTLVAQVNSTGLLELDSNYDYVFVVKPAEDIWFQNPINALKLLQLEMPVVLSYMLYILVVFGAFYVVFRRL